MNEVSKPTKRAIALANAIDRMSARDMSQFVRAIGYDYAERQKWELQERLLRNAATIKEAAK